MNYYSCNYSFIYFYDSRRPPSPTESLESANSHQMTPSRALSDSDKMRKVKKGEKCYLILITLAMSDVLNKCS